MKLQYFLKLIRWKNLVLISYVQILLKFLAFPSFNITAKLNNLEFFVLVSSILFIASAGYIINDIVDIKTDIINKPIHRIVSKHISVEKAKHLYLWLNTIGISLGIGLSLHIKKPSYSLVFIIASLLLYYYSKKIKATPLFGNIIVSFLISFNSICLYIFDINIVTDSIKQQLLINGIWILTFFAFFLNLSRELIKDIEDLKGDYNSNMRTLPILIGKKRTLKITKGIGFFLIIVLVVLIFKCAIIFKFASFYMAFFIVLPLLYCNLKMNSATTKKQYSKISILLKIIMLLGINSIIIFSITV
jgi:4-hydroxybenzoate polyprenyltransferase